MVDIDIEFAEVRPELLREGRKAGAVRQGRLGLDGLADVTEDVVQRLVEAPGQHARQYEPLVEGGIDALPDRLHTEPAEHHQDDEQCG